MEYDTPQFYHVTQYAASADRDVIDLVSGNPDWEPPTALREGLHEYADGSPERFQYSPSDGLPELKEEIATRRRIDSDRIIVTNGTGEANYLAMARALNDDHGHEVVLIDPVYPYYPGKVELLGGESKLIAANSDGSLDRDSTCDAITDDTALVVLNTPNNPTGAIYDIDSIRAVVETASDKDAYVMVDEVYAQFDFSGSFESALCINADNIIVTTGFSKSMAITGLRVGYAVFPSEIVDSAKTRHMLVNVTTSRPAQWAVYRAYRDIDPSYYNKASQRIKDRIESFTTALDASGAEYTTPDGGFYVLAKFENFPGTLQNVKKLIDQAGVAGMPGATFGAAYDDWLRFAMVSPRVESAAKRLSEYFPGE